MKYVLAELVVFSVQEIHRFCSYTPALILYLLEFPPS